MLREIILSEILPGMAIYFLPPLYLLLFYAFKNRRLVWLAIPAAVLTDVLCFWDFMTHGMLGWQMPFVILLHAALLAASIAGLVHGIKRPQKRTLAIIAAVIGVTAVGYTANSVLSATSDSYCQAFDKPVFARLTRIQPKDVTVVHAIDVTEESSRSRADFQSDLAFFAALEYLGSELSEYALLTDESSPMLLISLRNAKTIWFTLCEDDIFKVLYKNRAFYVRSPQLLEDIT